MKHLREENWEGQEVSVGVCVCLYVCVPVCFINILRPDLRNSLVFLGATVFVGFLKVCRDYSGTMVRSKWKLNVNECKGLTKKGVYGCKTGGEPFLEERDTLFSTCHISFWGSQITDAEE